MAKSFYKVPQKQSSFSTSTDAPTGGLNTRDAPLRRGPLYADNLTNWVATPNGVAVRKGYKKYATGIAVGGSPASVDTLMAYNSEVGVNKLFAAYSSGTSYGIVDATNPGPVSMTGAATQSGLNSSRWSHLNFTGAVGHYLVIANGVDPVRHWNGTSWVVWTRVDSNAGIGQVGGIEPSKFESVIAHQKRLWFVETNSTRAWYLPINSIGGGAISFDFGAYFPRGGKLQALTTWSTTGGTGMQNQLVAISSNGDVVVYQGTDPSVVGSFTMVGTWRLGAPIGNQCFLPFGGDTLLLSSDGLVPLSKFMQNTNNTPALSDTIRKTITDTVAALGDLPGFQLHDYLTENILILNIPQINPMRNVQFIFNTITGGWTVFEGMPAQSWSNLGSEVYFGGFDGKVYQAFVGYKDNAEYDGTGGDSYYATCQQSQNDFDKPGQKKRFVRAKINIQSAVGSPDIRLGCNVDFDTTPPQNTGAVLSVDASSWDNGRWDTALWGNSSLSNYNQWSTLGKIGYYGAIVIVVSVQAETIWISTDWEIQLGGS